MTREVQLDLLKGELAVGDYILEQEGHAVRRIDALIADTLALYEIILTEAGEDPIATEARCNGVRRWISTLRVFAASRDIDLTRSREVEGPASTNIR